MSQASESALEPGAENVVQNQSQRTVDASVAISLKRLADAAETLTRPAFIARTGDMPDDETWRRANQGAPGYVQFPEDRIARAIERNNALLAAFLKFQDHRFEDWADKHGFGDLFVKMSEPAPKSDGACVYLCNVGDGDDDCWVPCAKGDPGATLFEELF